MPERMCRVCRRRAPKTTLERWTRSPGGFTPDPEQRNPGRGYYTCSPACAAKLSKVTQRSR